MWFEISVLLVYFLYVTVIKPMNYWKDRNLVHSKPLPIFGNSAALITRTKSFVNVIKDLYTEFPDRRYNGFFSFRQPQLMIRDPELIKLITIKDFDYFIDRTNLIVDPADPIMSNVLVALTGQKWRDMRAILSPSFTSNKMKFMFQLLSECAERFTNYFEKESANSVNHVEMKDIFCRFTNDAIATTAFGVDVDSLIEKQNEFFLMGKETTNAGGLRALRFFGYIAFPALMKILKIPIFPPYFTNFFKRIVKETIEVRQTNGIIRPDMIHLLLQTRVGKPIQEDDSTEKDNTFAIVDDDPTVDRTKVQSPKAPLTDDEITAQALLFFLAGFDTTATLMSFMSYELATNLEVQKRLQKEIDEALRKCNGKVTYDVVQEMKYLDTVVSESLRKWPPGVALDRICLRDYSIQPKLPNEQPFVIEKGTSIMIPVFGIHRDPKYFPCPDKFDPERFNDENKTNIVSGTYIPFGAGPRNCIASRFALMETKVIFFHILAKLDIVPTEKTPIPLVLSKKKFALIPDEGFWLGLRRREEMYIGCK